jgi:hypothetical protein
MTALGVAGDGDRLPPGHVVGRAEQVIVALADGDGSAVGTGVSCPIGVASAE